MAAGDLIEGITLLRSSELLANLEFRHVSMPGLLAQYRPYQAALLEEFIVTLVELGVEVPAEVSRSLALVREKDAVSEEEALAHYEQLLSAQSQCIFALQCNAGNRNDLSVSAMAQELIQKACMLQLDILQARQDALDAIRSDSAVASDVDEAFPAPEIITRYLRDCFPKLPEIAVTEVRQLKGVNTKEVFFLQLTGHPDWPQEAVMRRNREIDTVGNAVSSEFSILEYLHRSGLPVPRPLFAGEDIGDQNRPFVVMERLPGRSLTVAELGVAASDVFHDLAMNLALLHQADVSEIGEEYRLYGAVPRERTLKMIDRFYTLWKKNKVESSIILESAYAWLRDNVNVVDDTLSIVHADYNLRNNLVHNGRIVGILDWELCHEGHPAEDLGYVRPQVEEVMPWSEFMKIYLDHGGPNVTDEQIRYFQIYGLTFGTSSIFPAYNGYIKGEHSDLLIGAAGTIEWGELEPQLASLLLAEYGRKTPRAQ
ncbi:MAG: phosphotransferase family protein [Porticoccaceae bacterium]